MAGVSIKSQVHVYADTELSFRGYPQQDRVAVEIGNYPTAVVLFLGSSDLDRLSAVLSEARKSLSVAKVAA